MKSIPTGRPLAPMSARGAPIRVRGVAAETSDGGPASRGPRGGRSALRRALGRSFHPRVPRGALEQHGPSLSSRGLGAKRRSGSPARLSILLWMPVRANGIDPKVGSVIELTSCSSPGTLGAGRRWAVVQRLQSLLRKRASCTLRRAAPPATEARLPCGCGAARRRRSLSPFPVPSRRRAPAGGEPVTPVTPSGGGGHLHDKRWNVVCFRGRMLLRGGRSSHRVADAADHAEAGATGC